VGLSGLELTYCSNSFGKGKSMDTTLTPISFRTQLASTPKSNPKYAVPVQMQNGETLMVADPRATRAMVSLMDMGALHGGAASHYGGPAAFAEIMSCIHGLMFQRSQKAKTEWYDSFNFVNDAGHTENGIYALMANYGFADLTLESLKGFRSIKSKLTGHGEAHIFPQGVLVSNGPLGSGLPQAQGLALGDGSAGKKRTTICTVSDGGAMEGEMKEAFAAIPGFAKRGKLAPFIMVISDNHTKLSGRIEQDSFSMEPTFNSLKDLGWRVLQIQDGNNLQACMATLEEAFNQVMTDPSVPIAIQAFTIKGKGNKKAEASATGAHGFPLKKAEELNAFLSEIYGGQAYPTEFSKWSAELEDWEKQKAAAAPAGGKEAAQPSEKIQIGVSAAMIAKRRAGLPVFSVSADLQGSTGVADFHKEFPGSSLDVGVAEANMISTAIGLSLTGYIPFVDTFAQFGATKGALPITMSSLSQAPVIGVFSHIGFQDAADGASHQALSYYAQLSSIPHVETYSLSCSSEAEALVGEAIEQYAQARKSGQVPPSRIFFLGRENFPRRYMPENQKYSLGQAQTVLDTTEGTSKSVTIVAAGSLVPEALKAAKGLKEKGIGAVVIHPSIVNKPDLKTIGAALRKTGGNLITVEEHSLTAGMSSMLTHALVLAGEKIQVKALAVKGEFGQSSYTAIDLYKKHGLDASAITEAALGLC
jgi:transketolase